jgi:prostamide/prostaglandin F2alpha synthase
MFCRVAARELSDQVKPILDANNVRFIGIGFDEKFVKPFVEGKFWSSELYVDGEKKLYNALNFPTFSFLETLKLILTKKWRDTTNKGRVMGIDSDLKGDKYQNGGTLIIDKNGKVLYQYNQEDAADHISKEEILNALEIKE